MIFLECMSLSPSSNPLTIFWTSSGLNLYFSWIKRELLWFFNVRIRLRWVRRQSRGSFMIRRLRRVSWCFCGWVASWFRFPWWDIIFHFPSCRRLLWRRLWRRSWDGCRVFQRGRLRRSFLYRFFWWVWIVRGSLFGWGRSWGFPSTGRRLCRAATKLAGFIGNRIRWCFPWQKSEFRTRKECVPHRWWSFLSKFLQLISSSRTGESLLKNKAACPCPRWIWEARVWGFGKD